jgi:hypothetical protein
MAAAPQLQVGKLPQPAHVPLGGPGTVPALTPGASPRARGVTASAATEGGEAGGGRPDLQLDVQAAKLLAAERRLQEASERARHLERRLRRAEGPKREKRKARAVTASPEAVQTGEAATTAADDPYAYDYYEGASGYGAESVQTHTPLSRTLGPTAKRSSSTSTTDSTGTRPRANASSRQRSASVGRRSGSAVSRPRAASSVGNIERTVSPESRCSEIKESVSCQVTCAAEASQYGAADGEDEYYGYVYDYAPADAADGEDEYYGYVYDYAPAVT